MLPFLFVITIFLLGYCVSQKCCSLDKIIMNIFVGYVIFVILCMIIVTFIILKKYFII